MMPPELILVPIDFSESSQRSLDVATDMASRLGSALLLVHIVPAIPDLPKDASIFNEREYDSELHQTASKQLSDLATTLEAKNLNVRTEVGTANDVGMEFGAHCGARQRRHDRHRHSRHDRLAPDCVWLRGSESGGAGCLPGAGVARKSWRSRHRISGSLVLFHGRRWMTRRGGHALTSPATARKLVWRSTLC